MKKLYLCLLAIAACFNLASATDWDFVLTVTQGADKVKATIGYSLSGGDEITLVDGDNEIHIPEYKSLFIAPIDESSIVSLRDGEHKLSKSYSGNYYEIYANYFGPVPPYTLAVYSEDEYRTKTVTVNVLDDASKVQIVRQDDVKFTAIDGSIEIPYNEIDEARLCIRPASYDYKLYKVEADGVEVKRGEIYHYVDLVDNSGDEPVFVQTINVTANYPEDMKYKITIDLDGPKEAISYIRVNDVDVDDIDACLSPEGFEVPAIANVAVGFDDKIYKIDDITVNGETKYAYGQLTLSMVDQDQNITIKAHEYALFDVKFNVTGAEGVTASLGSTKLTFVDGENIITFSERDTRVTFKPADADWTFESFIFGEDYDCLDTSDWSYSNAVYLNVEAGEEYTIVAKLIDRPNTFVVYLPDFTQVSYYYFKSTLNYYDTTDRAKPGYNVMKFRDDDEDGAYKFYCSSSDFEKLVSYKNGEVFENDGKYIDSWSSPYYPKDGDVLKIYFDNDPGVHHVTFEVAEDALEGYEVVKDLIVPADVTAPVAAVGLTRFTISPVSRAAEGLAVTVGDKTIEAVDGVYTFETEADTTVKVATPGTTGIEDILGDDNAVADVYNLQGIRVARQANSADIKALPAGLYIVNGAKVLVK